MTTYHHYDAAMQRVHWEQITEDQPGGYSDLGHSALWDGEKLASHTRWGDGDTGGTQYLSEGPSVYSPLIGALLHDYSDPQAPVWVPKWYLFDALGSTIGLTDESGALIATKAYDAFGTTLAETGSGSNTRSGPLLARTRDGGGRRV